MENAPPTPADEDPKQTRKQKLWSWFSLFCAAYPFGVILVVEAFADLGPGPMDVPIALLCFSMFPAEGFGIYGLVKWGGPQSYRWILSSFRKKPFAWLLKFSFFSIVVPTIIRKLRGF